MATTSEGKVVRVPANGLALCPLPADSYAYYLDEAVRVGGSATAHFTTLMVWPDAFEPHAGRLVVVRDGTTRKRTRPSPDRVAWKSPRGWKPVRSVSSLPLMVQYRNRSDGAYKYRMYCFHRNGVRDESVVLLHVTHTETSDREEAAGRVGVVVERNRGEAAGEGRAEAMEAMEEATGTAMAMEVAMEMETVDSSGEAMGREGGGAVGSFEEATYMLPTVGSACVEPEVGLSDQTVESISRALNWSDAGAVDMMMEPLPAAVDPGADALRSLAYTVFNSHKLHEFTNLLASDSDDDGLAAMELEEPAYTAAPPSSSSAAAPLFRSPQHSAAANPSSAIPAPAWSPYGVLGQADYTYPSWCAAEVPDSPRDRMDFVFAN